MRVDKMLKRMRDRLPLKNATESLMKKLTMGWHSDLYWSGLVWYTRTQTVNRKKCVGTGLTPDEAQADLRKQIITAQNSGKS